MITLGMGRNDIIMNVGLESSNMVQAEAGSESESEEEHNYYDNSLFGDIFFDDPDKNDRSIHVVLDGEDQLWEGNIEEIEDPGVDVDNEGYEDLEAYSIPVTSSMPNA
jgi:hypothetical protein